MEKRGRFRILFISISMWNPCICWFSLISWLKSANKSCNNKFTDVDEITLSKQYTWTRKATALDYRKLSHQFDCHEMRRKKQAKVLKECSNPAGTCENFASRRISVSVWFMCCEWILFNLLCAKIWKYFVVRNCRPAIKTVRYFIKWEKKQTI